MVSIADLVAYRNVLIINLVSSRKQPCTNVKLTGQTLRHIQWNVVILTSVCIPLLGTNDSPEMATPFRITWPSEDHWGDVSYQCEAYWTNLVSHTMKCSDTHLSMYIIISDKWLTWQPHSSESRDPQKTIGTMSHTNVKLTGQTLCHIQCNVVILTSVCISLLVTNDSPDSHTLQNHVTLRRPLGWCLVPMWSLLDKPCVT